MSDGLMTDLYVRTGSRDRKPNPDAFWGVSVSEADQDNGSPKPGDMIARNPENHADRWLVAEDYFTENFEVIDE